MARAYWIYNICANYMLIWNGVFHCVKEFSKTFTNSLTNQFYSQTLTYANINKLESIGIIIFSHLIKIQKKKNANKKHYKRTLLNYLKCCIAGRYVKVHFVAATIRSKMENHRNSHFHSMIVFVCVYSSRTEM